MLVYVILDVTTYAQYHRMLCLNLGDSAEVDVTANGPQTVSHNVASKEAYILIRPGDAVASLADGKGWLKDCILSEPEIQLSGIWSRNQSPGLKTATHGNVCCR